MVRAIIGSLVVIGIGSELVTQTAAQAQDNASDQSRPGEVEILRTMEDGGGSGLELHGVTISGVTRDPSGSPVAGADVFVCSSVRSWPSDFELNRGRTQSDEQGRFELKNVRLLVTRDRPDPLPKPVEGGFVVFAVKQGYGFTWHEKRFYRPYQRPEGVDAGDPEAAATDQAFYSGEPIVTELNFEPPATLRGRITTDLGGPIAGAKVQLGYVDDPVDPVGHGKSSCVYLGDDDSQPFDSVVFAAISSLPSQLRQTRTDADGRYELTQLRRDTGYIASIDPGPEFKPFQFRATTTAREVKRGVKIGYDGTYDHVFTAARQVHVRVVDQQSKTAMSGVDITVHPARTVQRIGSSVRTGDDGTATLRLLPGEAELFVEPPTTSPYLFHRQRITFPTDTATLDVEVELRRAAIAELQVTDADSGKGVPDIRFNYETDTSSVQRPLSSQTIFVDYAATGDDGILRAFVEPGKRRYTIVDDLHVLENDEPGEQRSELVEMVAGESSKVIFKVRRSREDVETSKDGTSVFPDELQRKWDQQIRLQKVVKAKISLRRTSTSNPGFDSGELLETLLAVDRDQGGEIVTILEALLGSPITLVETLFTVDGDRRRQDSYWYPDPNSVRTGPDGSRLPSSVNFINGVEQLSYSDVQNQATVFDKGSSRLGFLHLSQLCRWPSARWGQTSKDPKPEFRVTESDDQFVIEFADNRLTSRWVFDRQTGCQLFHGYGRTLDEPMEVSFFFSPKRYSSGLILPQAMVSWRNRAGKIDHFKMHVIDEVQLMDQRTLDVFACRLPAGCRILDYRGVPPRGPRVRPHFVELHGDVRDAIAHLHRLRGEVIPVKTTLPYGQPAPKLEIAHWMDESGVTETPNLSGNVVLIEFWGIGCGPCVGQLPEVKAAVRHFADQSVVVIGLHDSDVTVEKLQAFANKQGITYQLAIDSPATERGWFGKTMQAYGIQGIPHAAVIDQEGNLAFVGDFGPALRTVERQLQRVK